MGVYAIGTIPLMFGFGAFISMIGKEMINRVIKFSGVVVVILGLVMLNRAMITYGYSFQNIIVKTGSSQTKKSTLLL